MMILLHQAMLLIAEEYFGLDTSTYPPGLDPTRPRGGANPDNERLMVYIKARRMLHELAIPGDIPCVYFKDGSSHPVTSEDLEKGYWFSPDDNTLVDRNGIEPTLRGVRICQETLRAKLMELREPVIQEAAARPGPKPDKSLRVRTAMLADIQGGYDLAGATEEEMVAKYGRVSRDTCRKCRTEILSELDG